MASIYWSSKKLDRITRSPLTSKTLAFSEVAEAGILIAAMLQEIFRLSRFHEIQCKTGNVSLVKTLNSSNLVSNWHLRDDVARMKEMMVKSKVK